MKVKLTEDAGECKKNREEEAIKKSLDYSIIDGSAYSVMAGFGEAYVTPYALKLDASNTQIGFLSSIPALVGSIIQPFAARFTEKTGNRWKIIQSAVLVHALMWLPILLIPFIFRENRALWLILFFSAYVLAGNFAGPAWGSLMGDLVPEQERGRYFGRRNKITGIVALASTIAAGYMLGFFSSDSTTPYLGFVVLFSIALVFRLISRHYLGKMHEPEYRVDESREEKTSLLESIKDIRKNNFTLFSLYVCLINFATNIAGPFFTVYMLRDLGWSYGIFGLMNGIATLATLISMPYWGHLADKYGNKIVLSGAGMLVPFLPLFWLVSNDQWFIALVQVFGGFAWAGFNLTAFNYILDSTSARNRTRLIADYNMLNGVGVFLGASIGGLLAAYFSDKHLLLFSGLPILFLISGLLRLLVSLLILPELKENRVKGAGEERLLFWKIITIYPVQGLMQELVNGWKTSIGGIKTIGDESIKTLRDGTSRIQDNITGILKR